MLLHKRLNSICTFVKVYISHQKKIHSLTTQEINSIIQQRKMDAARSARQNPIIKRITSPVFQSIFNKNLTDLVALFERNNYEIRIAGGAVRDLLLDKKPTDIDFATVATPIEMKEMFAKENIRLIKMNGEKHGTITPRINDEENFEITTLRIDLQTDGRHAEVKYTTDWQLDANRRDLTINSMFLSLDGQLYDYFYGYDDLMARRIAFVGDAAIRIQEDYLRILRYFRFYGKIADSPDKHEMATLNTIAANIAGLQHISGERIWSELKQIIQGRFSQELICTLINCGAAKYIGLSESPDIEHFKMVCNRSLNFDKCLHPISLLCSFLHSTDDVLTLYKRLKLTANERDLALFLIQNSHDTKNKKIDLKTFQLLCVLSSAQNSRLNRDNYLELLKFLGNTSVYNELVSWELPKFPVTSLMLKNIPNFPHSSRVHGPIVKELKRLWVISDFTLTTEQLLHDKLPKIIVDLVHADGSVDSKMNVVKKK